MTSITTPSITLHQNNPAIVEIGGGQSPWISTWSGKKFHLYGDSPAELDIDDIAHHLSMVSRFTGATSRPYSVAEHSLLVMSIVDARRIPGEGQPTEHELLQALMHDAPEAYIADIASPFKPHVTNYEDLEERIWARVCSRFFGVEELILPIVKEADTLAFFIESMSLCPRSHYKESKNWDRFGPLAQAWIEQRGAVTQDVLHPLAVKGAFLSCFDALQEDIRKQNT